jgi:hypothetical protein
MKRSVLRGIGMAVVMLLLALLSVICLTLGAIGIQNLGSVKRYSYTVSARYAAMAGINEAANQLYGNPAWNAGFSNAQLSQAPGTYSVTFSNASPYYSTNNFSGATATPGYGGVSVPAGCSYIISSGRVGGVTQRVAAMVKKPSGSGTLFRYAIYAKRVLGLGNGETDSFNSSTWGASTPATPTYLGMGGDIACNGSPSPSPTWIDLGSTSNVRGNVLLPPGTSTGVVGGSSHISGTDTSVTPATPNGVRDSLTVMTLNPVAPPSLTSQSMPSGSSITPTPGYYSGDLSKTSGTITLTSGDYSFNNVSIGGSCTVNINTTSDTAPVRIFVRGTSFTMGGSSTINNNSKRARRLQIYCGSTVTNVTVNGGPQTYACIYAPNAAYTDNGTAGGFGGAIVCSTYNGNGHPAVRYDEALYSFDTGLGGSGFTTIGSFYYLDR